MKLEIGAGGTNDYPFKPKLCAECDVFLDIKKSNRTMKTFIVGSACNLPFKSHAFEKVIASHVIEHLTTPRTALAEIHRVLRWGGQVEVYTPNFSSTTATSDPDHKKIFNYFSLKRLVTQCGFRTSIHFPVPSRILPRALGKILLIGLYGELCAVGTKDR